MSATLDLRTRRRERVRIQGTVQGVGFRPHVYRLAEGLGLDGYVLNDARGVLIEVEGGEREVEQFLQRLSAQPPPLAVLERIAHEERPPTGERGFRIRHSDGGGIVDAPVTPDTATCEDCLRELFDPNDRRFRYPFINCTNCGPRFTIVRGVPYDRPLTTMADFRMCAECESEYADPGDRRFHAQPNACPRCGPAVSLLHATGSPVSWRGARDAVQAAATALRRGAILALKGLGGYHLACRADDERAVALLRARKHREDKPFALMARDLESARSLVELDDAAGDLLCAPQRPIVLAPRLERAPVAPSIAPRAPELGVMLPYTPLHHLIVADFAAETPGPGALVMTSGNVSDEPIAYRDEEAIERLAAIADLFLVGNRPIETRTDDSVVRLVCAGRERHATFLRRSRGYVPASIALPGSGASRPLLACGAELKSTFCLAKGSRAWVSHHIGDLENFETLRSFTEGIDHFQRLFSVAPEVVAHDLHPEYLSSKYALELDDVELLGVQHHHAHLAACLAEHGETGAAIGAIYDGSGYGLDGTVWGGEVLHGDLRGFRRVGHLLPVRLAGGDRAVHQPWRMACSWLVAAEEGDRPPTGARAGSDPPAGLREVVDPAAWSRVQALVRSGTASPWATSMGRLFDAVAALCGLRAEINYEGQAAIELEAACDPLERGRYPVAVSRVHEGLVIDPRETLRAVCRDLAAAVPVGRIAARFHQAIVHATVLACMHAADRHGSELVVLAGGAFANRRLMQGAAAGLRAGGLRVLTPRLLPPGDGAISYGQAAVAASRTVR